MSCDSIQSPDLDCNIYRLVVLIIARNFFMKNNPAQEASQDDSKKSYTGHLDVAVVLGKLSKLIFYENLISHINTGTVISS